MISGLVKMARTKHRARKLRAIARDKSFTDSLASDQPLPPRVPDPSRPSQGICEAPSRADEDRPLQNLSEIGNCLKRRKGADGDFYRPSAPSPSHARTSETDADSLQNGMARRPPLSPPATQALVPRKAKRPPKAERRKLRLLT